MTIGTGIALAGAWICLGIMWTSARVGAFPCLVGSALLVTMTVTMS